MGDNDGEYIGERFNSMVKNCGVPQLRYERASIIVLHLADFTRHSGFVAGAAARQILILCVLWVRAYYTLVSAATASLCYAAAIIT